MFPLENINNESQVNIENNLSYRPKSIAFNFEKGEFEMSKGSFRIISGKDNLNMWINKILKTEKFKYDIYSLFNNEYGVVILDRIHNTKSIGINITQIQDSITQALTINPEIYMVSDFKFTTEKRTLFINFTVNTTYGDVNKEVSI